MNGGTLDGQVAVVTGATGGMGQVIAVELARRGAQVVTAARNPYRADELRGRITRATGADRLTVIAGDLSRRADVLSAAQTITDDHPAVHLLTNNAGAHFPDRRLSVDGVEMHIALDYLAAYGLTALLAPVLRRGAPGSSTSTPTPSTTPARSSCPTTPAPRRWTSLASPTSVSSTHPRDSSRSRRTPGQS